MLGSAMVGASSGPPDSMTRTCAPDADNSAARTEPAAPAPTTMKSYRLSLFDSLIISNSQDLESALFDFVDPFGDGLAIATRPCASEDDGNPYHDFPLCLPSNNLESIRDSVNWLSHSVAQIFRRSF